MKTRKQIAQYIHELRAVRTKHLTPREKNRVIRGFVRTYIYTVVG